jgi:NADPH:quinone reductase-like Zn-dependent oxidoreductase
MGVHVDSPAVTGQTMRAVVQDRFGSADVLHVDLIERPSIDDDEVLVRVHNAGMDRGTWHQMTGMPYIYRLLGGGFRRPRNRVAGLDVAGTVAAVGCKVTRFEVGDEVYGTSRGSFADYASAREVTLAAKPATLSFEQAAVVPVSGLTALQAVRDVGRVQPGQHVLIIGASGGVGTYAVQVAKDSGAEVTGVCSTGKVDLVRSIGADHVVDYTMDDFAAGPHRYNLILDIGGNAALSRLRRALTPTGTLVLVGGEDGGRWTGGMGRPLRALALSPFVGQRLTMKTPKEHCADLERLTLLIDAGKITPIIEKVYPLEKAGDAMRRLAAGQVRGKLAITIREDDTVTGLLT